MNRFNGYTEDELNYIKENYNNMTCNEIANKLGKKSGSVSYVINKLGLVKQKHNSWTEEEIQYLKDNYHCMTAKELSEHLNHTVHAINTKKDKLGIRRSDKWTKSDVEFLRNNYNTMTYEEIGIKLNRTPSAICAKCFDLNLYKKSPVWTDYELSFLRNNYSEINLEDLSEHLGRTANAVKLKAERIGLKKYPYTCDYHFFDNIDTEEKAYWLGFLTADGWISKAADSNAGVTGIELQYGDIGHLKKFNQSIGGNYKITDRWRNCLISTNPDKVNHTCVLRIFSLVMYNSLVKFGFTNNKTFDCSIPELRRDLIRHFMRGYFDGDGCFAYTDKSFSINFITASSLLNKDIAKLLDSINISYTQQNYVNNFDTTMYMTYIYRIKDKIRFLDWIYKDCNIYLDRKYQKYINVKNYIHSIWPRHAEMYGQKYSAEEIGNAEMPIRVEGCV